MTSPALRKIDDPIPYVGRFIDDRETGETKFLASRNETGGQFVGEITDPYAVTSAETHCASAQPGCSSGLGVIVLGAHARISCCLSASAG